MAGGKNRQNEYQKRLRQSRLDAKRRLENEAAKRSRRPVSPAQEFRAVGAQATSNDARRLGYDDVRTDSNGARSVMSTEPNNDLPQGRVIKVGQDGTARIDNGAEAPGSDGDQVNKNKTPRGPFKYAEVNGHPYVIDADGELHAISPEVIEAERKRRSAAQVPAGADETTALALRAAQMERTISQANGTAVETDEEILADLQRHIDNRPGFYGPYGALAKHRKGTYAHDFSHTNGYPAYTGGASVWNGAKLGQAPQQPNVVLEKGDEASNTDEAVIAPGTQAQPAAAPVNGARFTEDQLRILAEYAAFHEGLHNAHVAQNGPFGANPGWARVNHDADLHAGCTFRTRVHFEPSDRQQLNPINSKPIFSVTATETRVHDYANKSAVQEAIFLNLRMHNGDINVKNVPSDMLADIKLEISKELARNSLLDAKGVSMPYVMINGEKVGPADPAVMAQLNAANLPPNVPRPASGQTRPGSTQARPLTAQGGGFLNRFKRRGPNLTA